MRVMEAIKRSKRRNVEKEDSENKFRRKERRATLRKNRKAVQ